MVKEKYYILYDGSGKGIIMTQENKNFLEETCGSNNIYRFDENTKKMLMENNVPLADTLYKTNPDIYPDLKEAQLLVDEFNALSIKKD